jgi:AraC-like DNA-binding protein
VRLGEWLWPAGSPLWRTTNCIGAGHHVVFPRQPVAIRQVGRPEFVTCRNHAVLYADGDEYERRAVGGFSDECTYLVLTDLLLDRPFPRGLVSLPTSLFLRHRRLLARRGAEGLDPLAVEELAAAVLAAGDPSYDGGTGCALAERAKELLACHYAEPLRLAELAGRLGTSPFHLARTFRARTGWTLHGYRTALRVRAAIDRLTDPSADLAAVATDVGFASHSHLTDVFRRHVGCPPSALRAELARSG